MVPRLPVSCLGLLIDLGTVAQSAEPNKPGDLFAPAKVWPLHIEMTAEEYEAMQPAARGGFGFPGGFPGAAPAPAPAKKPVDRETHRSVFGTDFPVAHASISCSAETVEDVAIRYKGNSTYLATVPQTIPQARHRSFREGQTLPRRKTRKNWPRDCKRRNN